MNKNTMTKQDIIASAAAVASDAAEGRLDQAALEAEVTTACRELVGTVVGEGDPLWPLQVGIARGVLAAHGLPAAEYGSRPRCSSVSRTPRLTTPGSATCPATPGRRENVGTEN